MTPLIHCIFVPEKAGFSKPQKQFFDYCFSRLEGISPDEVVIIGDSLSSDIRGGISYGLKTCWFNREAKEIPDDLKIDYVINSLEEVEQIL